MSQSLDDFLDAASTVSSNNAPADGTLSAEEYQELTNRVEEIRKKAAPGVVLSTEALREVVAWYRASLDTQFELAKTKLPAKKRSAGKRTTVKQKKLAEAKNVLDNL